MTFANPSNRGPIIGIVSLLILGILGSVFFFSFKECSKSGILRSGKTSDATNLYQVFPAEANGKFYLISLEGVFKTRIYERSGGFTQRSGSTDVRLTLRDLETGEQMHREVIGSYPESFTKILGVARDVIWLYNKDEGLHSRKILGFEKVTTPEQIKSSNNKLSEGFALAQDYLGNVEELFAYNKVANALKITTITGKTFWINATTFHDVEAPVEDHALNGLDDLIKDIVDKAMNGETPEMESLYDKIIQEASDLTTFSDINHTGTRVSGIDSCEYSFEGNTVKTIVRSNCIRPDIVEDNTSTKGFFITSAFLSDYDTEARKYINPPFLGEDNAIVFHSSAIGNKTDLLISKVNAKSLKAEFTIKTGIVLNNHRSGYNINGNFGFGDTLFTAIDNQLFSINLKSGKINWKTTIGKDEYYSQNYFIGTSLEKGKRYLITAGSYYTKLSQQGIFVTGRTDYKLMVIDAATGKTVKTMEIKDSRPEKLPYYLGMTNNTSWFYSKQDGLHTRNISDLKIIDNNFSEKLKTAGITSPLVATSNFDDAVEEKYISMDIKSGLFYFTTENGLHYTYDLASSAFSEVQAPTDKNYENWMADNPYVEFFRVRQHNIYHHELMMPGNRSLYFEPGNNMGLLKVKDNKPATANSSALKTNQFIEAQFLINGVSLDNNMNISEKFDAPLNAGGNEKIFYLLHKDKISPDAHQIITKYNYGNESITWGIDITTELGIAAEIIRVYTIHNKLFFIFKTHPDLDDNFVCVAIDASSGKTLWNQKF